MATIRAPFNFVPLSDKVVFPDWAKDISQDIPFEDGISGTIEVEVEAVTPIYVRNGHKGVSDKDSEELKRLKASDEYRSFSKSPAGDFFIPATSIKGELRHLVEILSFGKMKVDNKRYGIRDLQNRKYRDSLPYEDVHCGWMEIRPNGTISISDHGLPYRISHRVLDDKFQTEFCSLFEHGKKIKDENRTAQYKYSLCSHVCDRTFSFSSYKLYPKCSVDKRVGVRFDERGEIEGRIVFTGQPDNRKERRGEIKASGKFFEFVFPESSVGEYKLKDEDSIFSDFEFIYRDSSDYKYWKKQTRIPVFFKVVNSKIESIGLSYLYKKPFPKSISGYIGEEHRKRDFDMADCIFGEVNKNNSLRGRVHISHAFCTSCKSVLDVAPYLGGPKPTYYPIYMEQSGIDGHLTENGHYKTMMDKDARLRGWKLYPTRKDVNEFPLVDESQKDNTNPAHPLGAGSRFVFQISVHNLRKEEFGALLYAILLQKESHHSLGFAKSYGYGVCKYSISKTKGFEASEVADFIAFFKKYMNNEVKDYNRSEQLRQLFAMLNPDNSEHLYKGHELEYMELKDFVDCKKHNAKRGLLGQYLTPYTEHFKSNEREKKPSVPKVLIATVAYLDARVKQARLEGKNEKMSLDMNGKDFKREKLKQGDRIFVELIKNGKELRYINKAD